jgi:hypothetical protein
MACRARGTLGRVLRGRRRWPAFDAHRAQGFWIVVGIVATFTAAAGFMAFRKRREN